jgi:hypothetical protein
MNIHHTTIKVLAALSLTLSSCANMNDSSINLGDEYFYSTDSKWKKIWPSNGYYDTAIYSEVTDYNFNNRYIIAKQIPDYEHHRLFIAEDLESRYMIYCSYLKDSTSKTFYNETTPFIRKAISADSTLYRQLKAKHITDQNSIEDKKGIQAVLDSVFHHDPYYIRLLTAKENYWIIDKNINKRIGPLNKSEFDSQCDELRIDIKLKK